MSDEFDYNASAVTSYFVLNSRHNIRISRLQGSLRIVAAEMGTGMRGNGNRGDGKKWDGNAVLE